MASRAGACLYHCASAAGDLSDARDCLDEGGRGSLRAGDGLSLSGWLHHRRGDAADGAPPPGGELHSGARRASHGPSRACSDGSYGAHQHVGLERSDGFHDAAGRAGSGPHCGAERRHRQPRVGGLRRITHIGGRLRCHHRGPRHDARHRPQCLRCRLSARRTQEQHHLRAVAHLRRAACRAVPADRLVGHHPRGRQGSTQAHC